MSAAPASAALPSPEYMAEEAAPRRRLILPIVLFVATCFSTYFAWNWSSWRWTYHWKTGTEESAAEGIIYTLAVLSILGAHEMGHFLQAVRYRVPASLPYFIPMPISPIGTMGAVIGMQGSQADRKELFDIGLTGPLAGLVVALPMIVYGLWIETPVHASPYFGYPLVWQFLSALIHGREVLSSQYVVPMNPYSMAGWVGLLVTGLNMLPVSQLDGGHVSYALFGRHARWIAMATIFASLVFVWQSGYYGWTPMLVLLILMRPGYHPPTADDSVPLGTGRTIVGLLSLWIPVLCFTPMPLPM